MLFEMDTCGGCRTCEIACSFAKAGEFNHHVAAIEIVQREDGHGYDVKLFNEKEGEHFTCDGCPDRETPPCVEFCREAVDFRDVINKYVEAIS